MKFSTILILLAIAHATCSLSAQTSGVPEIQYRSVPDFLHLPADLYFGEVTGVAVNSKGHIFVFSRGNTTGPAYGAAAAQLLEFDSGREISARDWPQPLCMVLCTHGQD